MTNKRIKKLEPFHIFGFAVSLTLTIFTLVVVTINLNLRNEIRNQIINRDAETINLFTLMDRSAENIEKLPEVVAPWIQKNNSLTPSLWSSDLKGIIALQVFDADGNLKLTIPDNLIPASLKKEDFLKLQQLTLVSKFHEEIWLYSLFDDPRFILMDSPVPLLEVIIPVHAEKSNKLEVIFQYWVEGNSMSAELSQLDRQILVQTLIALGIGYLLILTLLIFAFKQLKAANKSLVDEIEQLVDAGRLRVWEKKFENNWYTFLKLIDSSDKLTEEEESKRYWAEYYDDYDREHPKSLSEQDIDNMSAFDYEGDPEDFEQWLESEGY